MSASRPTTDIDTAHSTDPDGGTTNLWDEINQTSHDLGDYVRSHGEVDTPPNVILIMTDDEKWSEVQDGFLRAGFKTLMRDQGTVFPRYQVVRSVCSPSRATYIGGCYNQNDKAWSVGGWNGFDKDNTLFRWLWGGGTLTDLPSQQIWCPPTIRVKNMKAFSPAGGQFELFIPADADNPSAVRHIGAYTGVSGNTLTGCTAVSGAVTLIYSGWGIAPVGTAAVKRQVQVGVAGKINNDYGDAPLDGPPGWPTPKGVDHWRVFNNHYATEYQWQALEEDYNADGTLNASAYYGPDAHSAQSGSDGVCNNSTAFAAASGDFLHAGMASLVGAVISSPGNSPVQNGTTIVSVTDATHLVLSKPTVGGSVTTGAWTIAATQTYYTTDYVADAAVELIGLFAGRAPSDARYQAPFYLQVCCTSPHTGSGVAPVDQTHRVPPIAGDPTSRASRIAAYTSWTPPFFVSGQNPPNIDLSDTANVAASTTTERNRLKGLVGVDDLVATIIAELDGRTGQYSLENTIIVYTSDNGWANGENGDWQGKDSTYDAVMKVPFVMRGPGIPVGGVNQARIANVDWATTLCTMFNVDASFQQDGLDIWAALGDEHVYDDRVLFITAGPQTSGSSASRGYCGVMTNHWKYCTYVQHAVDPANPPVLFDLVNDPYEMTNLYGNPAYASVQAQLDALTLQMRVCSGDYCHLESTL